MIDRVTFGNITIRDGSMDKRKFIIADTPGLLHDKLFLVIFFIFQQMVLLIVTDGVFF